MPPAWLPSVAAIYVPLSIAGAILVLIDIYGIGRRQRMAIMEAVWPLTTLYWGPVGLLFYGWFGRATSPGNHREGHPESEPPMWQAVFKGATHCGAGCALGDFIGDWIAYGAGLAVLGTTLGGKYVLAFALAYLFGIIFQYFSVAPMRGLGFGEGIVEAIKIDTLSLLAYEIGMFAWMGFQGWRYPELDSTQWSYWLMMQIAMVLGFATTYPVNWWLISRGTKEKM